MKTIRNLLALATLIVTAQIAPAVVPSTINYQGRLANAAGVPQPGTHAMSLKIYDAATAGTQLYAETIGNVTVDANGVYGFQFGAAGISEALAAGAGHWLELTVDGVAQSPRQKLLAVPFAMKSADNQELMILFQTKIDSVIPPGTVIAYAGESVPSGWLKCDGAAISRDDYSRLFQVVNTAHGSGDGSSTFNLPDYRGRFLRCIDGNAGRDPDVLSRTEMAPGGASGNAVGSIQNDQFKSHSHTLPAYIYTNGATGGQAGYYRTSTTLTKPTNDSGSQETRPVNAYVNYIIKF